MKLTKKLLSLLLVLVMVLAMVPAVAMADGGSIVMSFETYDAGTGTVTLLRGPEKVAFTDTDTGITLAQRLLGEENVDAPNGWMNSFTIGGVKYTADKMGDTGSWSVYKNNTDDSVGIGSYKPADGDVYRVILTTYDPKTYRFPVMTNDLDALYWAMAECSGSLDSARKLVQSAKPAQSDIDAMTASLSGAGSAHRVIIDGRSVQVDASAYPYKYTKTLEADKAAAAKGDTVTVTVTVPGGLALAEGYPKANGVSLTKAGDGKYSFVMPDAHVTLTVEFKENDGMSYADVSKGSWYYDAVLYAFRHDLMNGVGSGKFNPNGKLSRAMMATILYRLDGSPAVTGKSGFTDVAEGKWYTAAVVWAAENKIVNGMGDGKFAPDAEITREQLAVMLMRYCQYKGYDVSGRADMSKYTDMSSAGAWAADALKWARAEWLITGRTDTTIAPKYTATRAETATILMRFMENKDK